MLFMNILPMIFSHLKIKNIQKKNINHKQVKGQNRKNIPDKNYGKAKQSVKKGL